VEEKNKFQFSRVVNVMMISLGLYYVWPSVHAMNFNFNWRSDLFLGLVLIFTGIVSFLNKSNRKVFTEQEIQQTVSELDDHLLSEIKNLISSQQMIEAIKLLRSKKTLSLTDAKRIVEAVQLKYFPVPK
jgi:hypothetical protein